MTARELLDRRRRWVLRVHINALTVFVGGVFLGLAQDDPILFLVGLLGFVLGFMAVMWGAFVCFRCPRCRGNLAPLVFVQLDYSPRPITRCHHCGTNLDELLPETHPIAFGRASPEQSS